MAFSFFKKKEDIDLTKKGIDSDVPVEGYFKRKGKTPSTQAIDSSSQTSSAETQTSSSGGGFFSFFGNSDSSSSSSNSNATSSTPSSSSDYSSYSNSSSPSNSADTEKLKTQLDDLSYRISRILDRIELLEKKMDRLERKSE
jgi:predicted ribosome quality control (RQC) complex YloA/Tae2 family protein